MVKQMQRLNLLHQQQNRPVSHSACRLTFVKVSIVKVSILNVTVIRLSSLKPNLLYKFYRLMQVIRTVIIPVFLLQTNCMRTLILHYGTYLYQDKVCVKNLLQWR